MAYVCVVCDGEQQKSTNLKIKIKRHESILKHKYSKPIFMIF